MSSGREGACFVSHSVDFDGSDALYWEFLIPESGALLHKVDFFFVETSGDGIAVLTQAPANAWGSRSKMFDTIRQSLSATD